MDLLVLPWTWSSDPSAPPLSGEVRSDSGDTSTGTVLRFHADDADGHSQTEVLASLEQGDFVRLRRDPAVATAWRDFTVNSAPVFVDPYWEFSTINQGGFGPDLVDAERQSVGIVRETLAPPVVATCVPYDVDLGCTTPEDWAALGSDVQARSIDLAWASLRHLTGGRVGNCPVLVRPCKSGCLPAGSGYWSGNTFQPYALAGSWFNLTCGCGPQDCSCSTICEVRFPGPVALIQDVHVEGMTLDPTAYRLDNGHLLTRTDGECWPLCQDMSQPPDGVDAFSVAYVPGIAPGPTGQWAAGVLAVEFAKACTGQKCRLPSSVTSVSRQGVSMTFTEGFFAGGITGIREVDAYVQTVNPNHLTRPPTVWSPDLPSPRYSPVP